MTKKHFEMIAAELAFAKSTGLSVDTLACNLARQFSEINPRFDTDLFLRACGLTPSE